MDGTSAAIYMPDQVQNIPSGVSAGSASGIKSRISARAEFGVIDVAMQGLQMFDMVGWGFQPGGNSRFSKPSGPTLPIKNLHTGKHGI